MSGEITFEGWAVLELMGHRQRAGMVKDVEMFGGKLLRIDVPVNGGGEVTEFYGCASVYSLRPCTEEIAREHARRAGDIRPVRPVEFRERDTPAIAAAPSAGYYDDEDDNNRPF